MPLPVKVLPPGVLRAFQQVGRDLFIQGLNSSHSGNMSLREKDMLWITQRGAPLARLTARQLVPVFLEDPACRPVTASSELPVHLEIHLRKGPGAVVHAHPPAAVALSLSQETIQPMDLEGCHHLPCVDVLASCEPYDPTQMAGAIGRALESSRIVVVRAHGTFAWGKDLWEAMHWSSALEHSSRILLLARLK